jgi:hypothetical protein
MVKRKKAAGVPKEVPTKEDLKKFKEEIVKLPAHRAGLPGNVIPLYIVPRDPAQSAGLTGHAPAHQFHVISEGLIDQIKLWAEGHSGIIDRLSRIDVRLDRMEKENERQHLETRALVKISFSELDRRVSDLESQVKDLQEWKKQVQSRLQS